MTGGPAAVEPSHHWIRQDEFEIPGVPDSFQRLWTPHRLAYVRGEDPSGQCPYRHVADLTELDDDEALELTVLTRTAVATIRRVASPHAFNVGLNLGSAAGGSLSAHLHQHVVPRWNGDANFMPVLAGTKPIMQTLGDTRQDIAGAWPAA